MGILRAICDILDPPVKFATVTSGVSKSNRYYLMWAYNTLMQHAVVERADGTDRKCAVCGTMAKAQWFLDEDKGTLTVSFHCHGSEDVHVLPIEAIWDTYQITQGKPTKYYPEVAFQSGGR